MCIIDIKTFHWIHPTLCNREQLDLAGLDRRQPRYPAKRHRLELAEQLNLCVDRKMVVAEAEIPDSAIIQEQSLQCLATSYANIVFVQVEVLERKLCG